MTEFEYKLELAKKAVTKGKLSRRDFTKFALAGGLTIELHRGARYRHYGGGRRRARRA